MIILLGASGFIGQAIADALRDADLEFAPLGRRDVDHGDVDALANAIAAHDATFLINSAGYTGKPNVDACEIHKTECLDGNATLPGRIRMACQRAGIAFGHVSSGCIYAGSRPDGSGFTELDPPNFCFRTDNCSFYSGCKALGEELLADCDSCYIWRLRIPFNEVDSTRNYLSKVMRYERLLDATNSLSHLGEFASACVQSWQRRIPFGTYNVVNTGSITTRRVTELIQENLPGERRFDFFDNEAEFMRLAAATPRSNCVLDNTKIRQTGIELSTVEEALIDSLQQWRSPVAS
ncbi:sugar nucleotide-binding protein [Roseiconus nitratireducens]|uniref:dTDP-4-dehydrorhamnose reductase n=1 Tax=Roseiconus nitratireducens TaxID=2605748 RepID=A0A5M6DEY4_9BACT|nr:sugar nucleotide-binding protein [Roseiconus nitratireducens]KAA5546121.1 sugar nucleotide-binding protein [Roseiconus nitratireducens]